ncbi:MAG: hypothetical protein KAU01_12710 [Candidatus Cloacimonetes bacterium]|nr:hypothetical protein [Candidatus Cloacimonadota bacterium]
MMRLNKNILTKKQKKIINSLEGIGDIFVYHTKNLKKNNEIKNGLKLFGSITQKLFINKERDLKKFNKLMFTPDAIENNEKDKTDEFYFFPSFRINSIIFTTILNQVSRIFESSIEEKNEEISKESVYTIVDLLADISQLPDNELFVQQLLTRLSNIRITSRENNNFAMYEATIYWFTSIVFNKYRQYKRNFDLSYLELFNNSFFNSILNTISLGETGIFQELISFLHHGIHSDVYIDSDIFKYLDIFQFSSKENNKRYQIIEKKFNIEKQAKELEDAEKNIINLENLNIWKTKFINLKLVIYPFFDENMIKEADKIEKELKERISHVYKFYYLKQITFAFGAYCLFKKKLDYIKYLWEFKQPADSNALWSGHDIIPENLNEAINLYFKEPIHNWKIQFREDHHSCDIYYRTYFILLLLRILKRTKKQDNDNVIVNFEIPKYNVYRLRDIDHSINTLIKVALDLKSKKELLNELNFISEEHNELFDNKLIPFLNSVKNNSIERINYLKRTRIISKKKIAEFKEKVVKSYYETSFIRDIFKYYNLYVNKSYEKYNGTKLLFCISQIDDKGAFLDEWDVHDFGMGEYYGKRLSNGEDIDLLIKLSDSCKEIQVNGFEKALDTIKNLSDIFIISTTRSLYKLFKETNKYIPKWDSKKIELKINCFNGWYLFKNVYIPIFVNYFPGIDKRVLILNKSRLGRFIHYSPLDKTDNKELQEDIFYMNIQEFTSNKELIEKIIEEQPSWLIEIEGKEKQKDYLKEMVRIDLCNKFELIKNKKFQGYLIKLT